MATLKSLYKSLDVTGKLLMEQQKRHHFIKERDNGLHSDFWKNIDRVGKDLSVLEKSYIHLVKRIQEEELKLQLQQAWQ